MTSLHFHASICRCIQSRGAATV